MKQLIFKLFVLIFVFASGVMVGHIVYDFPFLTLDHEVNIVSLINLVVTVVIAFMIPFFVSKILQDSRDIKEYLISEVKELIELNKKVKKILVKAYLANTFSVNERNEIIHAFHEIELKVGSIQEQMRLFSKTAEAISNDMKIALFKYKDFMTGGRLMLSTFVKVDDAFYQECGDEHMKIETIFKTSIQKIHKL